MAIAEKLTRIAPDMADGWSALSWIYAETDRHEEAVALLQKFVADHPKSAAGHAALAWRCHYMGEYEQERFHAQIAYGLAPRDRHTCWTYLAANGDPHLATEIAQRFPDDAFILEVASRIHSDAGLHHSAVSYAERAQERSPGAVNVAMRLAGAYHQAERWPEAAAAWEHAASLPGGRSAGSLGWLAVARWQLGEAEWRPTLNEAAAIARSENELTSIAKCFATIGDDRAASVSYRRVLRETASPIWRRHAAIGLDALAPPKRPTLHESPAQHSPEK